MTHVPVPDLADRLVLVTGAASGIGRAVAEQAAEQGARLVLTDVRADDLAAVADRLGAAVLLAEPLDVTDHDAVAALARQVHEAYGPVDVVANVAGISAWGTVSSLRHETWRAMVEVNLMGPIHVIEEFVPAMVERGRGGHLVNVASAAGIIGMPWHAAYSASKFGLRGVSEVLRFDLAAHGVGVSLVCPGAVATPLTETVRIDGVDATTPRFQRLQARFRRHAVSPEEAAAAIWTGVRKGRYWVYTSRDIAAVHALQRHVPPLYAVLMRLANRQANRALPEVGRARR